MFRSSFLIAVFILGTILVPVHGYAQLIFGIEWTFTNEKIIAEGKRAGNYSIATKSNARARDKMANAILGMCGDCTLESKPNSNYGAEPTYRIWFSSHQYVDISVDPWVIEINASPMSRPEFESNRPFLNQIFEVAERLGVQPHKRIGGGHIHIDFDRAFGGSDLAARNFIVDLVNHPELAMGALGRDYLNAAPLAMLSKKQRVAFEKAVSDFDANSISLDEMIKRINTEVYNDSYDKFKPQPSAKYQAINLLRALSTSRPRTIELRFFRPPRNYDEHLMAIELLEARIKHIKTLREPIAFINKAIKPDRVSKNDIAKSFVSFVAETGLEPQRYMTLLPNGVRSQVEPLNLTCPKIFLEAAQ